MYQTRCWMVLWYEARCDGVRSRDGDNTLEGSLALVIWHGFAGMYSISESPIQVELTSVFVRASATSRGQGVNSRTERRAKIPGVELIFLEIVRQQERQDPLNHQWQDGDEGQNGYCASIIWVGDLNDVPAGAQPLLLTAKDLESSASWARVPVRVNLMIEFCQLYS
ncbi:hypothetical protein PCH_Pc04g00040 [Penicillium rubens Wisconsin 54-1255]|uniref:Uncharacterized protein n=1 Tax=Penicillium rubens (strain ATCC 28089 / DSM 1075 / NRRL 1951 / Wisconsin 54-1255) TaxID=500485 RepID=B6GVS8_PENRW|nr:hypothetical protein PCH_Pc04g00040 [Penicillium rubens Wisconsin 54-1255]